MNSLFLVSFGLAALGAALIAASFVSEEMMLAIPLPRGNARRALRPIGAVILVLALLLPLALLARSPATPPETPTATPTDTPVNSPFPTIAPVFTVTPRPTATATPGTPAPVQAIRYLRES